MSFVWRKARLAQGPTAAARRQRPAGRLHGERAVNEDTPVFDLSKGPSDGGLDQRWTAAFIKGPATEKDAVEGRSLVERPQETLQGPRQ
eukprot:CAMPEP_0184131160 /NCGR_PEP_ID=MMETSP0974-20121125/27975_1 /TAXON_ID=483370 /ORGANISM="non described non described, Strain CCMP2097" /LENGTH=88 /DNA_ID=CAMNT_0026434651 /DNA_START=112 /DNA_END=377 /DNA_ORIENTATION=+